MKIKRIMKEKKRIKKFGKLILKEKKMKNRIRYIK